MAEITDDRVRDHYDGVSAVYDAVVTAPACDGRVVAEAAALFARRGYVGGTVLDLGCGTGRLGAALGEGFDCTGFDLSPKMLDRAAARGYTVERVDLLDGLRRTPPARFDYVVALSALYHLPAIDDAMAHMRRIARVAAIFSMELFTEAFIRRSPFPVYAHGYVPVPDAAEDRSMRAWISPSQGVPVHARLVCIETRPGRDGSRELPPEGVS